MSKHLVEHFDRYEAWDGLLFTAPKEHTKTLQIEICENHCMRLLYKNEPLFWMRVFDDYFGYELLKNSRDDSLNIVPPISAQDIQSAESKEQTFQHWARFFASSLLKEPSPLANTQWRLGYFPSSRTAKIPSALPFSTLEELVEQPRFMELNWDFRVPVSLVTLRALSTQSSGRVKMWRKRIRENTLPPLLVFWVSGIQTWVLLDGHDRLLACFLEGVDAPIMNLEPVEQVLPNEVNQEVITRVLADANASTRVDQANHLLIGAFFTDYKRHNAVAQMMPGGFKSWRDEVNAEIEGAPIHRSEFIHFLRD